MSEFPLFLDWWQTQPKVANPRKVGKCRKTAMSSPGIAKLFVTAKSSPGIAKLFGSVQGRLETAVTRPCASIAKELFA